MKDVKIEVGSYSDFKDIIKSHMDGSLVFLLIKSYYKSISLLDNVYIYKINENIFYKTFEDVILLEGLRNISESINSYQKPIVYMDFDKFIHYEYHEMMDNGDLIVSFNGKLMILEDIDEHYYNVLNEVNLDIIRKVEICI